MRIVYLAGVGALWNGYLSYLNQKDVVAQWNGTMWQND
jgi:hypothetical protein